KLLTGAAVAVAALSMMSCAMLQDAFGVADLFSYSDATYESGAWGKWSIKHTNENNNSWDRGGKLLLTKHSDMSGKVTIIDSPTCGPMGVLFNVSRNKDRTYNFCVAAVGDGLKTEGKMGFYVSYFGNIKEEEMAYVNFGAATYTGSDPDVAKDKSKWTPKNSSTNSTDKTQPYEIEFAKIQDFSADYTAFDEDGKKVVFIDVKEITEGENVGGYEVNFYLSEDFDTTTGKPKDISKSLKSVTILASQLDKDGVKEGKVGVYANVYPERTLVGSLEIMDLTNDAVIANF
ncbi:MAG: hypothetical protein MJ179_11690, partial [Treponema sp.]|nr:hypothetical protein [Treponema sp.]